MSVWLPILVTPPPLAVPRFEGRIFADNVVVADFQPGLFAFECEVLGLGANRAERKEAVMGADFGGPMNHHV